MTGSTLDEVLEQLNEQQRAAATHGSDPLLIVAGAGTGKTTTLAHRVASLIIQGTDPRRILLLTFTRRAAAEMMRRVDAILYRLKQAELAAPAGRRRIATRGVVSGTFHAVATQMLRQHGSLIGLRPEFTILDRSDSEDLLNVVRSELQLPTAATRFPLKGTCLDIYSRSVNTQRRAAEVIENWFPWVFEHEAALRDLFRQYVDRKHAQNVLDYDDLLLYWHQMMAEPTVAAEVAALFDHVLVDEYQDTNRLQAEILLALRPCGTGLTVVGDDAQAIYGFRAATVRNILEFPGRFEPPAAVVALEQNYRSTQPILEAANALIAQAPERYAKRLFSLRASDRRPRLVTVEDEQQQASVVTDLVLEAREQGVPLRRQAVLFRTAHHSDLLEIELGRRDVPFVKYGGLRFLEAAHVKDLLAILRWAQNPRDTLSAFRVLQLLPGVGPRIAARAIEHLDAGGGGFEALVSFAPPPAARREYEQLAALMPELAAAPWPAEVQRARDWYEPYLQERYDAAPVRAGDLEQLELIATHYPNRERFLTELTLDPPAATGEWAGPPHLDEDYLVLSTIHSAKGQEFHSVYVLNVADGCIPSDMATGSDEEIEEERRLLYVAMTRAQRRLVLLHPRRFYVTHQRHLGDRHVTAPLSRFLPPPVQACFERVTLAAGVAGADGPAEEPAAEAVRVDVAAKLREMW